MTAYWVMGAGVALGAALAYSCRPGSKGELAFSESISPLLLSVAFLGMVGHGLVGEATRGIADPHREFFARGAGLLVVAFGVLMGIWWVTRRTHGTLWKQPLRSAGFGFGVYGVAYPAIAGIHLWHREHVLKDGGELVQESMKRFLDACSAHDWPTISGMMVVLAIVVPCFEEAIFRGALYTGLFSGAVGALGSGSAHAVALVGSTAVFTVIHPSYTWLPVALMGALIGAVYRWTGSLWGAWAFHALHNAVTLLTAMGS